MKDNIELRDFFAAQLMSGKANDLYDAARRKNIAKDDSYEEWIHLTAEEATQERIENAAKMSYRIADALLKARSE